MGNEVQGRNSGGKEAEDGENQIRTQLEEIKGDGLVSCQGVWTTIQGLGRGEGEGETKEHCESNLMKEKHLEEREWKGAWKGQAGNNFKEL